ncbi:MAG: TA system VapC family ribonuclease toxin [Opitutales bacterium]
MILPDTNLLLYAYDEASPFHEQAKAWWEGLLSQSERVGLCPSVLFAFIRIGTNARAYENPLSIDEATDIVREWMRAGCLQLLEFTAEDSEAAMRLLQQAGSGGNLTTDAQIAATAQRLHASVHTADTDFARLAVDWKNPLEG